MMDKTKKMTRKKKKLKEVFDTSNLLKAFIETDRESAQTFRKNYDDTLRELDTFARGEQWNTAAGEDSTIEKWHGKPVTNYIHVVKHKKTSEVTYSDIKIQLLPLSSKHMDKVQLLDQVINNIWKRMNAMYYINETVKDSRLFPYGVTKVQFQGDKIIGESGNLHKGQLQIKNVDPTNFYWDPKATSIEEADYAFELVKVNKAFLLSQTGFDKEIVEKVILAEQTRLQSGDPDAGDIFTDTRDYTTGQDKGNYILIEVYIKYPINATTNKILKAYICNNEVLWKMDDIHQPELPYSILLEYKQTHEFAGKSSAMLIMDNQKFINQVDGIVHNLATQNQNPQKIVSSESGLDPTTVAKFGDTPGAVFQVDGDIDKAIRSVAPSPIDKVLLEIAREKKNDIMVVANINGTKMGESIGTAGATASGVGAIMAQSNQQDSDPKYQFQHYIRRVVSLMLNYIKYNNEDVEYRIDHNADNPHEYSFKTISAKDYRDIGHDIIIDVPFSQFEKQQKKNELFQLLSLQTQTGVEYVSPKMVIEMLEFPNQVELINHLHETEEQMIREREMKVAQITGELLGQAIAQAAPGVSLQQMAQAAAMQAVQTVDEQEKQKKGGTGGGAGVSAPQN